MKKVILVVLSVVMILELTGCGNNKNNFDVGDESDIKVVEKRISLLIKDDTLTKFGATLILKNDSDNDVEYGESYEIEIKEDDKWHKIDVELNFNLIVYILKPNTSEEIELNWGNGYGKLSRGDYRIVKDINEEKEDGTFEHFYVAAEFTIK